MATTLSIENGAARTEDRRGYFRDGDRAARTEDRDRDGADARADRQRDDHRRDYDRRSIDHRRGPSAVLQAGVLQAGPSAVLQAGPSAVLQREREYMMMWKKCLEKHFNVPLIDSGR